MRVVHRGQYYPGWDLVGAAHGLHLVSTKAPGELLRFYVEHQWKPRLSWNVFGLPVALLPGWLASVWPWERWPHVVTPCLAMLSVALVARALKLPLRALWMVLLPLGASSALLSYTVAGFPYLSNTLPYAIALWVVFRWRHSVAGTVLLSLLVIGLSWHVQELGRTAFVVFIAAALTLPAVPRRIWVIWAFSAVAWWWLTMTYPSSNTAHHATLALTPLATWPGHALALARHFAEGKPDVPVLVFAAVVAVAAMPRERWFWAGLLLVQAGLVFVLAANTGETQGIVAVWPRRTLVLSFISMAACAAALRERGFRTALLAALLAVGNVWQTAATIQWARRPLDAESMADRSYTLPFTHTPLRAGRVESALGLDSTVPFLLVDWYVEMRAEVAQGHNLLLVYNLLSLDENATDPAGIIDRLYLGLGHARFLESVFVFGEDRIMGRELPIRPTQTFAEFVASIEEPTVFRGYWLHHPKDERDWPAAKRHREEVAHLFSSLDRRFRLAWGSSDKDRYGRLLHRFSLHL